MRSVLLLCVALACRGSLGQIILHQVNVNAQGQNITGDAGNEPSIAVNPLAPNSMVIGWRQFDNVADNFRQAGHAYSRDGGRTWINTGPLDPGNFRSDPCLRADNQGNIFYLSLQGPTTLVTSVFETSDGGATFSGPFPSYGGDKQWLAIDQTPLASAGTQYQHWSTQFSRSFDHGHTWTTPISNITPDWGVSTVGANGTLYIAGVPNAGQGSPIRCARSTNASNPAATPTFTTVTVPLGGSQRENVTSSPNPGGLLGQVWVDTDKSNGPRAGWVYVLCSVSQSNDPLDIMFNRSTDGGQTWLAAPIRVNPDPANSNSWQWFGTMCVAPNGRIDVVYNSTQDSLNVRLSKTYYTSSSDGGTTWSTPIALTPQWDSWIGFPNQNKIGDYYDLHSDRVGADLAFTTTLNGEEDVYYARLGSYDCNGNGIPDEIDIANGTEMDCNGNGIPDSCEIAADPSLDLNHNGILDSCERHCTADFDGDGAVGTDADIQAFFACLSGNCCARCASPDFNGDGAVGTDADIESFFRVLAGGAC
jgi:hypothetical protein